MMSKGEMRGVMRAVVEHVREEIEKATSPLRREIEELKARDATRIERIREAAEEGRRRAMVTKIEEIIEPQPVEHDGQT